MVFRWLSEILNPPEEIVHQDPYFGRITFLPKVDRWKTEMQTPLAPQKLVVDIEIGISGPTDEHRARMSVL